MNVPGLTGTWKQRNAQLYENLGSPLGSYKGNLEQNLWLLNQIKNNNYFKESQPWVPQETTAATTATTDSNTLAQQYTGDTVSQVQAAQDIPLFANAVGTLKELWNNRFLPGVSQVAQQQIRPEYERQLAASRYDYLNNLYGAGGQRMGTGPGGGIGTVEAAANRDYLNTYNAWVDQQKGAFNTGWYEPTQQAWNESRTQGTLDQEADQYKVPTWQEVSDKYLTDYGVNDVSLF